MPENKLRELWLSTGMSQRAFGEWLGIPRRTVESWCMGVRACPEWAYNLIKEKVDRDLDKTPRG